MVEKASPIEAIRRALPAVQAAVREEIAMRIAAGEAIARVEGDTIVASQSPSIDLATRRQQLLDRCARDEAARNDRDHKSVA